MTERNRLLAVAIRGCSWHGLYEDGSVRDRDGYQVDERHNVVDSFDVNLWMQDMLSLGWATSLITERPLALYGDCDSYGWADRCTCGHCPDGKQATLRGQRVA